MKIELNEFKKNIWSHNLTQIEWKVYTSLIAHIVHAYNLCCLKFHIKIKVGGIQHTQINLIICKGSIFYHEIIYFSRLYWEKSKKKKKEEINGCSGFVWGTREAFLKFLLSNWEIF